MSQTIERITMGLGTFRRPKMLSDTLRSLSEIEVPAKVEVTLVLADNDEEASAKDIYESFLPKFGFASRT